jgi:hypothetical protein
MANRRLSVPEKCRVRARVAGSSGSDCQQRDGHSSGADLQANSLPALHFDGIDSPPTFPHRQPAVVRGSSKPKPWHDLPATFYDALMRHALASKTCFLAALLGRRVAVTYQGRWVLAGGRLVCGAYAGRHALSPQRRPAT